MQKWLLALTMALFFACPTTADPVSPEMGAAHQLLYAWQTLDQIIQEAASPFLNVLEAKETVEEGSAVEVPSL